MDDSKRLAERTRAAVLRALDRPPLEVFDDLVRRGFIDRQGRVTRLIGGTAEPELLGGFGVRRVSRARVIRKAGRRGR